MIEEACRDEQSLAFMRMCDVGRWPWAGEQLRSEVFAALSKQKAASGQLDRESGSFDFVLYELFAVINALVKCIPFNRL